MNTTNITVGAGALVVLGRWSEGAGMDVKIVVGVVVLAVILSALPDKVSGPLSALVLATVMFRYVPGIITKTGLGGSS